MYVRTHLMRYKLGLKNDFVSLVIVFMSNHEATTNKIQILPFGNNKGILFKCLCARCWLRFHGSDSCWKIHLVVTSYKVNKITISYILFERFLLIVIALVCAGYLTLGVYKQWQERPLVTSLKVSYFLPPNYKRKSFETKDQYLLIYKKNYIRTRTSQWKTRHFQASPFAPRASTWTQ